MARVIRITSLSLVLSLFFSSVAQSASGITYHGRILKADDTPLTSSTAQFRIQVRTPGTENCLLWEESQSYDMSSSNGVFSITIADTAATAYLRTDGYSWGLDRVFSNRTNFTGLTNCTVGTDYNPTTSDGRTLQVYFRETPVGTWEAMPLTKINFVPIALNTVQLEGYRSAEFLKIDPLSSYTTLTPANVNSLVDLITGASTVYIKPADALGGDLSGTHAVATVTRIRNTNVVATAPTLNQVLKFNGTNWAPAADDAGVTADASYAAKGVVQFDTNLATSGISVTAGVASLPNTIVGAGPTGGASSVPVLTYDNKGRLTAVTTATVDDTTKLPLAGGTMTGPINMGTQNITNATSVAATNFSGRNLVMNDNDTNTVTIRTPTDVTTNYILQLPPDDGTSNQILTTDGAGVLTWTSPASGISVTANQAVVANGTGTGLSSFTCAINQVMGFDGAGLPQCQNVTAAGGFVNGGNSFGAAPTLGTNDNFDLNFETNATTKMTILANGNVGIGTTTPSKKFVVDTNTIGDGILVRGNSGPSLSISNGTYLLDIGLATTGNFYSNVALNNDTVIRTGSAPSNGNLILSSQNTTGGIIFATGSNDTTDTSKMLITNSGNVGIGTTSPNTILDVNGALSQRGMAAPAVSPAGQGRIYFDSTANKFRVSQNNGAYQDLIPTGGTGDILNGGNTTGAAITVGTNDNFAFNVETNGTTKMTVLPDGKVGVGVTNPTRTLHLNDAGMGNFVVGGSAAEDIGYDGGPDDLFWFGHTGTAAGHTAFVYGSTEILSIWNDGTVAVGNITPSSRLEVDGALTVRSMAAPAVSPAGRGRMYFDSTAN